MNNQRGGLISKMIFIPIGLALMAGFFVLGYYVGKYQSRANIPGELLPPLPDVASRHMPTQDEFTFFKTLTSRDDKTVSLDSKPKPRESELRPGKKETTPETRREKLAVQPIPDRSIELKLEKPAAPPAADQVAEKQRPVPAKKETVKKPSGNGSLRYTLQIGSYQEKEAAADEVKRVKKLGYAAFIVASELPGKGTWYRVRLGSFSSKASAEKLRNELKAKDSLSTYVTLE